MRAATGKAAAKRSARWPQASEQVASEQCCFENPDLISAKSKMASLPA
jgi:hypothetical protein